MRVIFDTQKARLMFFKDVWTYCSGIYLKEKLEILNYKI